MVRVYAAFQPMSTAADQVQFEAESRAPDLGRSPMLQISTEMVRLYKEAFGRGPTKARAQFAGSDLLVVTLEDSLTVAERKLVALGELDRIRETRMFFQHALEDNFRDMVER